MSNNSHTHAIPPARTHAEAAALFRRPFAPGAIGFRAMTKVPYNGQPYAGAQDRGWGAALTLIAICFILMIAARLVTARFTRYSR